MKLKFILLSLVAISVVFISCEKEKTDLQKLEALKNVSLSYDSLQFNVGLPEGSLSGQSFQELRSQNEELFSNLANYTVDFTAFMKASNKKENASDAAFQGMVLNTIIGDNDNSPIQLLTGPFEVLKNEVKAILTTGTINLQTHKHVGRYIFQQMVDDNSLATKINPIFNYKVGELEGGLNLPQIQQNIPTSAPDNMKGFLTGLLESGLLD